MLNIVASCLVIIGVVLSLISNMEFIFVIVSKYFFARKFLSTDLTLLSPLGLKKSWRVSIHTLCSKKSGTMYIHKRHAWLSSVVYLCFNNTFIYTYIELSP